MVHPFITSLDMGVGPFGGRAKPKLETCSAAKRTHWVRGTHPESVRISAVAITAVHNIVSRLCSGVRLHRLGVEAPRRHALLLAGRAGQGLESHGERATACTRPVLKGCHQRSLCTATSHRPEELQRPDDAHRRGDDSGRRGRLHLEGTARLHARRHRLLEALACGRVLHAQHRARARTRRALHRHDARRRGRNQGLLPGAGLLLPTLDDEEADASGASRQEYAGDDSHHYPGNATQVCPVVLEDDWGQINAPHLLFAYVHLQMVLVAPLACALILEPDVCDLSSVVELMAQTVWALGVLPGHRRVASEFAQDVLVLVVLEQVDAGVGEAAVQPGQMVGCRLLLGLPFAPIVPP
mmetsp:Transcript_13110/g.33789  ORF Transcript_13110/g.33789 Transcript_13110/m.33789 type:complete len:354 (+) Transcript_13110:207-1268(+)